MPEPVPAPLVPAPLVPAPLVPLRFDTPLRTERLTLRQFRATDAEDLFAYQSLPETIRYLPWPLRTRAESAEHLAKRMTMDSLETDGDALVVALELETDSGPRVIGDLTAFLRSVEHGQAEVGWVLHPDFTGKGYAVEGVTALIDLLFARLSMHRVFANLDPRNSASVALCLRLGMREEAHFVEDMFFKGEWSDTGIYAILRPEWESRRR